MSKRDKAALRRLTKQMSREKAPCAVCVFDGEGDCEAKQGDLYDALTGASYDIPQGCPKVEALEDEESACEQCHLSTEA